MSFLESLMQSGSIKADGRRVDKWHRPAYRWMMEQMKLRLPHYYGGYPIWVWLGKPDLRTSGLLPRGEQGIRLELEIPSERILTSDFNAWHFVLNNWFLALNEKEEEQWLEISKKLSVAEKNNKILESWQQIFDLKALSQSEFFSGQLLLQGVMEKIYLEDVKQITNFEAR